MQQIHINRLAKLTHHLRFGKLGHETFDFKVFNDGKKNLRGCGTNGCQLGELPIIFPQDFEFGLDGGLLFNNDHYSSFLSLSPAEVDHLFFPNRQEEIFGGQKLFPDATKEQVADNNEAFIRIKCAEHGLEFPKWIKDPNHKLEE